MPSMPFLSVEKRRRWPGATARWEITRIVHLSPSLASTPFGTQGLKRGPASVSSYGRPCMNLSKGINFVPEDEKCAVLWRVFCQYIFVTFIDEEGIYMSDNKRLILVFGATGQQGGSVATALLKAGWPVRALVRDPASNRSAALRDAGVEIVQGDFSDTVSLRAAMGGVHGVFSVQPSSPTGTVSDDDEIRFGISVADLARECGVAHLVYSSVANVEAGVGLGHFESKARIEAHIRTLPLNATIIRPSTFMEMLVMPGFGLDSGEFNFFMRPDQPIGLLAVRDIGKCVAAIFADPARFVGTTLEIAGDTATGRDLATLFTEAAGRSIKYARFPDEVLAANPFLRKLTDMLERAKPADEAELLEVRRINPEMQSMRTWLAVDGREAFQAALGAAGTWAYNQE
jgi:uncharacterized protein YbjT (DUF2867 family)